MPARKKANVDWEAIRQDVKEGKPITAIAKQHGMDRKTIRDKQDKEGWTTESGQKVDDGIQERAGFWLQVLQAESTTARTLEQPSSNGALKAHNCTRTLENGAMILALCEEGASPHVAAQSIGVTPSNLTRWKDNDPEFKEMLGQATSRPLIMCERNMFRVGANADWKASQAFLAADKRTKARWKEDKAQSDNGITVTITSRDGDEIKVTTGK